MNQTFDAVKAKFRQGRHAEAIAECEALCGKNPRDQGMKRLCATMHALTRNYARSLELLEQIRDPAKENADILFNIALCHRELKNFAQAERHFQIYTEAFPGEPDGWTSLAECKFQLHNFGEGVALSDRAIQLDPSSIAAWTVRGNCLKASKKFESALASYDKACQIRPAAECLLNAGLIFAEMGKPADAVERLSQAIQLAPDGAQARLARAQVLQGLGQIREAIADYKVALKLVPADSEALKGATLLLLEAGQGQEAIEMCRDILKSDPDNLTARLGAEWLLTQLVPLWHVPMMNEPERNQSFHDGLSSLVTSEKLVFEIGTGSGLVAMMAARLGARKVFTCEAVGLIAETAKQIVKRNQFQDQVTVLAKPSHAVEIGKDLPEKADILVHEIFSSELLGEHVLPAIEDAKRRLLKPDGQVMPARASIMIALVTGEELGKNLHVTESFGFDLRPFNAIHPRKRPLYREDLSPVLMSADVEAFRFDFARDSEFPAERKLLQITATSGGLCYGVIQWIRIDVAEGVVFDNHPSRRRPVSNWQHTIFGFTDPVQLEAGSVVSVAAMHDRARPWFELAAHAGD
jgi:type II protein arginine methyltransferase